MRLVIAAAIFIIGCDKPRDLKCEALQPSETVAFGDGSQKICHRVSCNDGCEEWVCRNDEAVLTCRPMGEHRGN